MNDLFEHYKRLSIPYINWIDRNLKAIVNLIIGLIIGGGLVWINTSWQL